LSFFSNLISFFGFKKEEEKKPTKEVKPPKKPVSTSFAKTIIPPIIKPSKPVTPTKPSPPPSKPTTPIVQKESILLPSGVGGEVTVTKTRTGTTVKTTSIGKSEPPKQSVFISSGGAPSKPPEKPVSTPYPEITSTTVIPKTKPTPKPKPKPEPKPVEKPSVTSKISEGIKKTIAFVGSKPSTEQEKKALKKYEQEKAKQEFQKQIKEIKAEKELEKAKQEISKVEENIKKQEELIKLRKEEAKKAQTELRGSMKNIENIIHEVKAYPSDTKFKVNGKIISRDEYVKLLEKDYDKVSKSYLNAQKYEQELIKHSINLQEHKQSVESAKSSIPRMKEWIKEGGYLFEPVSKPELIKPVFGLEKALKTSKDTTFFKTFEREVIKPLESKSKELVSKSVKKVYDEKVIEQYKKGQEMKREIVIGVKGEPPLTERKAKELGYGLVEGASLMINPQSYVDLMTSTAVGVGKLITSPKSSITGAVSSVEGTMSALKSIKGTPTGFRVAGQLLGSLVVGEIASITAGAGLRKLARVEIIPVESKTTLNVMRDSGLMVQKSRVKPNFWAELLGVKKGEVIDVVVFQRGRGAFVTRTIREGKKLKGIETILLTEKEIQKAGKIAELTGHLEFLEEFGVAPTKITTAVKGKKTAVSVVEKKELGALGKPIKGKVISRITKKGDYYIITSINERGVRSVSRIKKADLKEVLPYITSYDINEIKARIKAYKSTGVIEAGETTIPFVSKGIGFKTEIPMPVKRKGKIVGVVRKEGVAGGGITSFGERFISTLFEPPKSFFPEPGLKKTRKVIKRGGISAAQAQAEDEMLKAMQGITTSVLKTQSEGLIKYAGRTQKTVSELKTIKAMKGITTPFMIPLLPSLTLRGIKKPSKPVKPVKMKAFDFNQAMRNIEKNINAMSSSILKGRGQKIEVSPLISPKVMPVTGTSFFKGLTFKQTRAQKTKSSAKTKTKTSAEIIPPITFPSIPSTPEISFTPPKIPFLLPKTSGVIPKKRGVKRVKKEKGRTISPPSATALLFQVYGKPKKWVTGLEFRPIPIIPNILKSKKESRR